MDVTRENFKTLLPQIQHDISQASFLAVDGEFTGLGTADTNINAFDTPESRYRKLRNSANDFLPIQIGLSVFEYKALTKSYHVKTYNFYVFPHPFSRQAPDIRFLCQTSSIDFLVSQGFDFNKLFKHGVPYLCPSDEDKLRDQLLQKHQQMALQQLASPSFTSPMGDPYSIAKGPPVVPDEHKEYIEEVCKKIDVFLKSDEETLALSPTNGYLRKLVFQNVALRFKSGVQLESKTWEKTRFIEVTKIHGEEDFKRREEAKRQAEMDELDEAAGFSKVISMISDSGKLLVGHNMILDLLHMLHRFRAPLPEDYEDFKSLSRCVFPRLLDTKVMGTTQPFKEYLFNTALAELHQSVMEKPFSKPTIVCEEGYKYDKAREHEAGYDAFITGCSFISMINFLGTFQKPPQDRISPQSPLVEPFLNKLFLMRVYDIPYLNLAGPDLSPSRDHVFHASFPYDWKSSDVMNLFSAFGSVHVAWIDDSSAFVALHSRDNATSVLKSLAPSDVYRVISYKEFRSRQHHCSTPRQASGTPPVLKRKMPSSDVDLPVKKKRTSDGGSPYTSNRDITPIPEEDESMVEDSGGSKDCGTAEQANGASDKLQKKEQEIGEPAKKKSRKRQRTDSGSKKVFEESSDWS